MLRAPILIAFARGKWGVGIFVPEAAVMDNLLAKISWKKEIPRVFRSLWLKIVLNPIMGAFAIQHIFAWGNYTAVGMVFVRSMFDYYRNCGYFGGLCIQTKGMGALFARWEQMAQLEPNDAALDSQIKYVTFDKERCVDCKSCSWHVRLKLMS